jgi:uncharacterized membrane protein
MTIRDRGAIHQKAGQSLADAQDEPKKIILIYLAVVTVLSLAVAGVSILLSNRIANTGGLSNMGLRSILSTAKTVLPLAQSLILLGLEVGYATMALRVSRGEAVSKETLFGGFRRFFPMLRAQIVLGFLYFMAAMAATYISAYLFLMLPMSEALYELLTPVMESASALGGAITLDEATMAAAIEAMMPVLWIFTGVFLLLFIPMHYRYRMMIYRLIDQPRPGALRAIFESRVMMRRNRFALFRLDLSLWWFYGLQALITTVCYGDMLLPLARITLPWPEEVSYFLFMSLSLALQFAVYYFFMNRVAVTYATAYETLLPQLNPQANSEKPQMPTNAPWQNQY